MRYRTDAEMVARFAARRRISNMWFVYLHRTDTRWCRRLLASPPGSYVTMDLAAPGEGCVTMAGIEPTPLQNRITWPREGA